MSYHDIHLMHQDRDLIARVTACVALEGDPAPEWWVTQHLWVVVARPDWEAAYGYALSTGAAAPGRDPGVITDQMILSAVQAVRQ